MTGSVENPAARKARDGRERRGASRWHTLMLSGTRRGTTEQMRAGCGAHGRVVQVDVNQDDNIFLFLRCFFEDTSLITSFEVKPWTSVSRSTGGWSGGQVAGFRNQTGAGNVAVLVFSGNGL